MTSAQRVVLKEDRSFAVSDASGAMRSDSPDGHGLWLGDTRMLSEFRLVVDGREPESVRVRTEAGWLAFELAAGDIGVLRERYVDRGLHERITFTNRGTSAIQTDIELGFGADFAAMLAVRGAVRGLRRPTHDVDVVVRPAGRRHRVDLSPGQDFSLVIVAPAPDGAKATDFDAGLAAIRDSYCSWAADCAGFKTDNPALDELLHRSRDDIRMLCEPYPTGIYPTGGVPWYAVPFGRDALVTALFTLSMNPEIARGTLRFLAAHQGRVRDPASEEEPGKILHEVRTGEAVERGLWPQVFFGTADATPLYLCALGEALDWTADQGLSDQLWPSAQAALAWCETFGDPDGDGYIEYVGGRGRNQGWKDSNDSLTHVDGTDPSRPAALCEVQGYLYRALVGMARKRPELKARAAELKRRFNHDFWIAGDRFVAQALDAQKRRVEAITSNPGHCLWSGILSAAGARAVASRLVLPDLFSGWGIRTLSTGAVNYDPCNGANGAVWAHDSAIAAEGLRRAGFVNDAELVARSVLEAGIAFRDRRIPEFWCGADRVADRAPDVPPQSCSPQAWSAAAPFALMATLLGLTADAPRGRLRIAPCRTSLWNRLEVTGLHFAGHRIDFAVEGDHVELGAVPRGLEIETR